MLSAVRHLLLGSPLPTAKETLERLTKVQALAVFSGDALSSVIYAPEEILLVLVAAGSAGLGLSLPIALTIVGLLAIVTLSYYQTIHGYPSGGGGYTVAKENLGVWPGLMAAAALLTDYVLNVAVSVTVGVGAMTSAFPVLIPFRVQLCLLTIALIAWSNLRGVRESGTFFSIPTYSYVFTILLLIAFGLAGLLTGTLSSAPAPTTPAVENGAQALTLALLLRAFASGCTALTGIEAMSNGVPAFQKPESDNAGKTLIAMATLLATMFLGVAFLAQSLQIIPGERETVVSQIGRQVFGGGVLYLALQAATALFSALAANTSFADFPRLTAIIACDRYLPRQLTNRGDRLVFANGIFSLALVASALIVIFGGQTHRLIPLFAVGAFLTFTMSQAGMVRHWHKVGGQGWQWKAAINGLGAIATGVALLVITATKFARGAWILFLLIPAFVWMFHTIKHHYGAVGEQLSLKGLRPEKWTDLASHKRYKVVIPISGVHRGTLAALHFALSMSRDVAAVTVEIEPQATARLREAWATWGHGVPLVMLESPYRSLVGPLLAYLDEVDRREPERGLTVVVLPEFIPSRWWQTLLHNQTARLIKAALIYRRGRASKDRVIIDVPYHLRR
jgi:amino acid transporter